ncbi:MAG: 50S ribosomal protein L11 methyltransferase [Dehalococcoidia bacterium]|nr:50S ribosomal protein L11 methyltransferase [Dehalococcoidia bacterium]
MASSEGAWVQLAVTAASADLEAIADLLREYAPGAVWIEPAIETSDHRDFAYRVLERGTVRAALEVLLPEVRQELEVRLARLPLGAPAGPLVTEVLEQREWAEEWKRFYHVLRVGEHLVVRPSWEAFDATPGDVVIVLDPGAAFGTGQHPSTRLCLAALEREVRPGDRVLDVGCGSGILSVAAVALGASEALGVDIEEEAPRATEQNAAVNGFAGRVRAATGSLGTSWPWPAEPAAGAFDVVVANISAVVLAQLLPDIAAALAPGGRCVGAGFIDAAAADVHGAVAAAGLRLLREDIEEDESGIEWRCLVAVREG